MVDMILVQRSTESALSAVEKLRHGHETVLFWEELLQFLKTSLSEINTFSLALVRCFCLLPQFWIFTIIHLLLAI
jgi:hypothetical protein